MENTLLNLIPSSYIPEVHLSQYDIGRELTFKLMDGNTEYSVPSGATVTVKATKPSGLGFVVSGTFSGNIVTIVNTETMTNESGRFSAELSISSGATLLGTSNFIFNIERSPHPEGTTDGDAETLIPELTLLVNEIRESNAKVESMTASASPLPSGSNPTAEYDAENNNLAFGIPVPEVTEEDLYKAFITKSASGSIASFSDGGDDLPMKSLKVNIVPKQSGSGDPSPSNVRPISGWDSVAVTRCGKNLMPLTLYDGFGYNLAVGTSVTPTPSSRVLTDNGDGTFSIAFTSTWQSGATMQTLPPSGIFCFAATVSSTGNLGVSMYLLDESYKVLTTVIGNSNPVNFVANIDLANYPNARYIAVAYTNRNTANVTLTITNPQFTVGTTATDYEPYNGSTITINLPQTVYGGTLDVVSGKLTIDRASKKVSDMSWSYIAPNENWTKGIFYAGPVVGKANGINNIWCERYKTLRNGTDDYLIFGNAPNTFIYIVDSTYSTVSAMVSAIGSMPFIYELATPTEIQLTPTQVNTLLGSNNIWSESGTVEVEYRADSTLAYEELANAIISLGGNI